jgi:DNA-binding response OmpR family regulator
MDAPRVLVVEDDEPVASMLCILLEAAGYRCARTTTAEEGWDAARPGRLEAAVVDLRLPGRDGWWLIERLRDQAATHRLPIVVITGFMDDEVVRRAAELSCACLGKPFSFTMLTTGLGEADSLAESL